MPLDSQIPEHSGLRQRVKWLLTFRLAFASVLLIATAIWRPGGEHTLFVASFVGVFTIIIAHLLAALSFYILFKTRDINRIWGFAISQIVWDLFFTTAFVSVTGGLDSDFKYLYWLTIVLASVLLFRVGAFIAAALSGFMYGALLNLQYFGLLIPLFNVVSSDSTLWPEDRTWRSIILQTAGFFIIAYVFGALSNYLRQAETALSEKSADLEDLEVLMKRIVESMTSGLATLDANDRINYWSRAAEEITGLRIIDVRGKSFSDIFPQAQIPPPDSHPWRLETKFQKRGGDERILGFSMAPLNYGINGQPGTLVIFQDLTQYRIMEEQVKKADRLSAIGELSARIAHEIRNPLTSVSGSIEVLRDNPSLNERDRRLMDIVVRETDRLNQLITDFLTFARPALPNFEEVALDELIKETSELFARSQRDRVGLKLALSTNVHVRGDSRHLNQMIWNLVKNASEASPEGEDIKIQLTQDESSSEAVIEICDNGPGVSPEIQEKIFTPFFTTKAKGTGLGLAIVRRIAEEHRGHVVIDRNLPKGTIFRIRLPLSARV